MPIEDPRVATDRRRHRAHLPRRARRTRLRGSGGAALRLRPHLPPHPARRTPMPGSRRDDLMLDLTPTVPLEGDDGDVRARVTVAEGDLVCFVLESGAAARRRRSATARCCGCSTSTHSFWQNWVERGAYRGRWREMVYRSAITLKLLTYSPSGAIVAAATGGLPEQVGGERNWDYRYTWVRDGSFSVRALLALGFEEEAVGFAQWMRQRVEEKRSDGSTPLDIMYRVDGSSDLVEETLDHLDGYRSLAPGADRERRRIAAAARHLRRVPRRPRAARRARVLRRRRRLDRRGRDRRLDLRVLGSARGGHLGDPRRPEAVRVRAAHVLGRLGPGHPDRGQTVLARVAGPLDRGA